MRWTSLIAIGAIMGSAAGASAQLSAQGGPIQIEADRLDALNSQNRVVYLGNVDAIQGNTRIRAEELTIIYAGGQRSGTAGSGAIGAQFGEVEQLIAEGEVFYITPNERARADRGEYNRYTDTITLTGNVIVTRDENVITGDKLTINVSEERFVMSSESSTRGDRVMSVIVPGGGSTPTPSTTNQSASETTSTEELAGSD